MILAALQTSVRADVVDRSMFLKAPDLLQVVKFSGCTVDGLFDGLTGLEPGPAALEGAEPGRLALFARYVEMVERSHCVYINRAVETWDRPPDFRVIARNIAEFKRLTTRPYVFGAFLAEHVSLERPSTFTDEARPFSFRDMCDDTPKETDRGCFASFGREEYRKYIYFTCRNLIDGGIQVFLFGSTAGTERRSRVENSALIAMVSDLRRYAAKKGVSAVFIAQNPSTYGGRPYLDAFDLIQGGVYIDPDGTVPDVAAVTNKGPGSKPPIRLWLSGNESRQPLFSSGRLVEEYDFFSNPLDDASEFACLAVQSESYLQAIQVKFPRACPLNRTTNSAVSATAAIYAKLKRRNIGFWLPGRVPISFPPWEYTPLDETLYRGDPRFAINFNQEEILAIPPIRSGVAFSPDVRYSVGDGASVIQHGDGRFCFEHRTHAQSDWCLAKGGSGATTKFGPDGNLVQTSAAGERLWESRTAGRGVTLEVVDGSLAIRDAGGAVVWKE